MAVITEDAPRTIAKSAGLRSVPAGVTPAPVCPMTADGAIDYATYEKLIDFHCAQASTVVLCAVLHVAESLNLSMEERKKLAEVSVNVTAGRVPVMVNVSTPGTDHAVELARHAEAVGADAIIAITPYYWNPPTEAVYLHYAALCEVVDIGVMAYNSPVFQGGVSLDIAMLIRLIETYPNFIGLKEASHNFETFIEMRRLTQAVRPDFQAIIGIEYLAMSFAMGGVGTMSALGGIAPATLNALCAHATAGDFVAARPLEDRISALWNLTKPEYPSRIKAAMGLMGRRVGPTRLPIRPADDDDDAEVRAGLEALGLFDAEPTGW